MAQRGLGTFGPAPGDWTPPIPRAVFLDTSVVIDLETYGAQVWDGMPVPPEMPEQQARQVDALRVLMALASRAPIGFAVSEEVVRQAGGRWYVRALAQHWQETRAAFGIEDRGLAPMTLIATLPARDQLVLAQAYRTGCDAVLTNDLRWMRSTHRRTIGALGLEAHTPESLLEALRPWLPLWL